MYYLVSGCVVRKSGHMNNSEKEVIITKIMWPKFFGLRDTGGVCPVNTQYAVFT